MVGLAGSSENPEIEQLVLDGVLRDWERWAAELLESHISYPVLCYFRSQHDNQSWLASLTSRGRADSLAGLSHQGEAAWEFAIGHDEAARCLRH